MAVIITAAAHDDQEQAFAFELDRSVAHATAFVDELESLYERLNDYPRFAAVLEHDIRRAVLHRTGYNVFYRVADPDVIILRVLHGRMNPSEWPR